MRRLSEIIDAYFLPKDNRDIQEQFYEGLCLISGVLAVFVVVPVNALQHLPAIISVGAFTFGLLSFGLYSAARRGRYYPKALFAGLLATLNVGWFPNAGSHGSIGYYFFTAALYAVIFFPGIWRWLWLWVSLVFVNFTVLVWVEYWSPRLPTPFRSDFDRLLDLTTGFAISGLAGVLMVWVVIAGYRRERARLGVTVDALDESRTLLSALIDSTDDMVWLVEPRTFGLVVFNAALAATIRRDSGLALQAGVRPEVMLSADAAAKMVAFYARALDQGPYTTDYTTPDGRVLLLSFSLVRHHDAVYGVSVFAKDITDRRRADEERERLELQLIEAQKIESLGSLAGGVAHDFNNMLGGILGYTDLLLADEVDPVKRDHLQAIRQAATRSGELTQKLLAFGRRGKNIVGPVDMNAVARDCVTMLRPSFRVDVAVDLALDASWTIDGDPSQIGQMVLNLCINASEAMPKGGRLTIGTRHVTLNAPDTLVNGVAPGAYVELRIADSGVGMTREVQSRIFEPFFTTKVGGEITGTGLGLSTVYGIVKLHHGTIGVESSPGRGTTFTVCLPKGALAREMPQTEAATHAGRGLLLIVEDEALLRSLLSKALTRIGYTCITAVDGVDGVEVFRERHGDLKGVILDLKMPRMGGREAFVELQTIDSTVPVLICSGYGDNEEAQGLITLGARGLLAKPFGIADLSDRLVRMLA